VVVFVVVVDVIMADDNVDDGIVTNTGVDVELVVCVGGEAVVVIDNIVDDADEINVVSEFVVVGVVLISMFVEVIVVIRVVIGVDVI
jgi:hypothetical protein